MLVRVSDGLYQDAQVISVRVADANEAPVAINFPGEAAAPIPFASLAGRHGYVAVLKDWRVVVVRAEGNAGNSGGSFWGAQTISFQIFASDGTPVTPSTLISGVFPMGVPWVEAQQDGGFLMAFAAPDQSASGVDDRGHVGFSYNASGQLLSGPRQAYAENNGFGAWSYGNDGVALANGYTVSVSMYNNAAPLRVGLDVIRPDGVKVFDADVTPATDVHFSELAALADGKTVLVVWSGPDAAGRGVFRRIFSTETLGFVTQPFQINQNTIGDEVGAGGAFEADNYALAPLADGALQCCGPMWPMARSRRVSTAARQAALP